jgi:hypothetical protein
MLKRILNESDIVITDKIIPEDGRKGGYNIGDLLNMPHLANIWGSSPHADLGALNRMKLLANNYKDSVLDYYCSGRINDEENVPNINLIKNAVEQFKTKNQEILEDIRIVVKEGNVCCVHIRNGDLDTELDFIKIIIRLSYKFNKIIILSGVHLDCNFKDEIQKKRNFLNTMNNILAQRDNIYIYLSSADIHLSIMSEASNLLVHKGGFSCLGSIVCNGNLFITNYFSVAKCNNWISKVNKKYTNLAL